MSVRVLAFVEGKTEEKFIKDVIVPELYSRNVFMSPTTPGRGHHQGGVQAWGRIRRELLRYLKEDKNRFVTTMFDYYGLPTDWPGRKQDSHSAYDQKAETVERAMMDDIRKEMGSNFDMQRFIPYVQMHEFEALLFSEPAVLGKVVQEMDITDALQRIANSFHNRPEEINDNPDTAPSKRLVQLTQHRYQKVVHGIIAAKRIGIHAIRRQCSHFDGWLTRLESLGRVDQ